MVARRGCVNLERIAGPRFETLLWAVRILERDSLSWDVVGHG
jgi:hypothetical protein